MKSQGTNRFGRIVVLTALLAAGSGFAYAAAGAPMEAELAARKEMVRKQQEQRITPAKRKAAAQALKAERIKVHQARQAARQLTPGTTDNN